ncbi:ribonucleoside-diphosphate reductase NrdZ [archaeon BMS3Bbin16]|nr:ribonucleoside-diphosphate reductase NrdZ [archaeon BMS3Bbin16]
MGAGSKVSRIVKRDGRVVEFMPEKIAAAVDKALKAVGETEGEAVSVDLAREAKERVQRGFRGRTPTVEDVQDIVEKVLIEAGYVAAAKAYILYRQRHAELRDAKRFFGVADDLKLGVNAVKVLERRYLLKDESGRVVETPGEMFRRVATAVSAVEKKYDKGADLSAWEDRFYRFMTEFLFLPNSPTLMNAGTSLGQLSACFVIPVEDSIAGIFDAVKDMALIHQSGGGTGFSFSRLRPRGDVVRSTHGVASGPVSFMHVFDSATEVIKQGGRRRGANMGVLRVDHPDIIEFISAKEADGSLSNFNISVGVTEVFMRAVQEDERYPLINPRTGEMVKELRARDVFDLIATSAWRSGDPGIVFLDKINEANPTPLLGMIECTNPCGEMPLLPFESCNLGSINLSRMAVDGKIDFELLESTVRLGVRFLDNVIDATRFPIKEIERMTKENRKIGLGVMGFSEMLIQLGIAYDSEAALEIAESVMSFIFEKAVEASVELAGVRGSFPNFAGSIWEKRGFTRMRNAAVTTIAPTGTISIIAGTTSGIEPLFAVSFIRNVMEGTRLLEVNPFFEKTAKEQGFYSKELMIELAKGTMLKDIPQVPGDVKNLFATALEIKPEWHVRMQAAFQKHVDNAVSKTVNLPTDASIGDVRSTFQLAYELGCKGITVYRYGSKNEQVLSTGLLHLKKIRGAQIIAGSEYAGGCPTGEC